jgi:transposase InsO family protein
MWGLDLVGPLQKAPGGFSHLLVAIDKFSKVQAGSGVLHEHHPSLWVPNSIITDNGTQFTGKKFLDFCEDHHIRVD